MSSSVKQIFQKALDLDEGCQLDDSMAFEGIPGWDSLGHMRIVMEIEALIGVPLEMEEIIGLDTVGKIRDFIESRVT
jgi:acyl carrier protein